MRTKQQDIPATPSIKWGNGGGSTGSITDPGSNDWTISRSALGVYVFTFTKPFTSIPVIVTTPYYGGNGISANVQARSASGFTVATFQFSPYSAVDSNVMFAAFGMVK
jgi:hypothetical protein